MDPNITQGPGGNVSVKENDLLWIKASGLHLANSYKENIFVPIDLNEAHDRLKHGISVFNVLEQEKDYRPSIETAMHVVIGAKFVAHVHSVNAISIAMLKNPEAAIKNLSKVCSMEFIQYKKPGIELAREISNSLNNETNALLLGNHGITVWGESANDCEILINGIEEKWKQEIEKQERTKNAKWVDIILQGMIFPDELVFLGQESFKANNKAEDIFDLLTPKGKALVEKNNWIEDFLRVLEQAVRSSATLEEIRYLTLQECAELLNWDAEKYRQGVNE
jgi:rhamnose utilization protein RhaD (predicted bifunctional aldolase and dehydrogenase)